jgi:sortase B
MASHFKEEEQAPKKKPGRGRKILSIILLVVGLGLLATAAYMFFSSQEAYHEQDVMNEKLAAYATVDDSSDEPPVIDWEGLKAVNADVCGWIYIPGTVINYPVYQGSDNDYYLNTNAEGQYGVGGQIFLDYENTNPGMKDEQTIIYGHHLKNGSMFKQVADMDDQSFFDSIETVWYLTPDQNYELEPLLVYYTDGDDLTVRQFEWNSVQEFREYLEGKLAIAQAKRSDAQQIIDVTSNVLTLSTCNYIDGYGRTILICVPKSQAELAQ